MWGQHDKSKLTSIVRGAFNRKYFWMIRSAFYMYRTAKKNNNDKEKREKGDRE